MEISLVLTMIAVFTSVALVVGSLTYVGMERSSSQNRRLRDRPHQPGADLTRLNEAPGKVLSKLGTFIPKSPKTMGKLQRRLALAGLYKGLHVVWGQAGDPRRCDRFLWHRGLPSGSLVG